MNNQFDELTKNMAQSLTRRAAVKKFGLGLAGMVLACFGLANKAGAAGAKLPQAHCQVRHSGLFGSMVYTGICMDINRCVSAASADCPANGTIEGDTSANKLACLQVYDSKKRCSLTI